MFGFRREFVVDAVAERGADPGPWASDQGHAVKARVLLTLVEKAGVASLLVADGRAGSNTSTPTPHHMVRALGNGGVAAATPRELGSLSSLSSFSSI